MNKKTWLITGISSGIGKALAEEILKTDHFLIGTFRQQNQTDSFNDMHEGRAFAYTIDLGDPESIRSMMEHLLIRFGTIDVLVNNAGVGFAGAVEEASVEEVRNVMEVNFFGALRLTQLVLPGMRKNRAGHIVQISSHAGIKAFAGFGIYSASKFALEGFSEALADEVRDLGVHVTIVEPGPFRTRFAGKKLPMANQVIPDYETTAGAFRKKLSGVHGKQEGDPIKAAKAILKHVTSDNESGTLRLPLGTIPLKTIQMKLDQVQKDLEKSRMVAESAVF